MTGKKENKKYSSYSFDCRDEPAMHNMQNISKIKICRHIISDFVINTTFLIIIWHTINQPKKNRLNRRGNDSNLLIVFYVQIMPDDFVMQLHR
ncbi:hypothetical protein, partial [Escherichia coli]|uniref:hypothetical protein n=2 Tax=Escherichia coli TaxID=562 RepID=UPI0020232301